MVDDEGDSFCHASRPRHHNTHLVPISPPSPIIVPTYTSYTYPLYVCLVPFSARGKESGPIVAAQALYKVVGYNLQISSYTQQKLSTIFIFHHRSHSLLSRTGRSMG